MVHVLRSLYKHACKIICCTSYCGSVCPFISISHSCDKITHVISMTVAGVHVRPLAASLVPVQSIHMQCDKAINVIPMTLAGVAGVCGMPCRVVGQVTAVTFSTLPCNFF